jgi:hypothetical protein
MDAAQMQLGSYIFGKSAGGRIFDKSIRSNQRYMCGHAWAVAPPQE